MELVQHPFHDQHPLVLSIISEEDHYACSACTLPVDPLGPLFICSQKCGFVLHKSCADLPKEITHFSHKDHPLALSQKCPYESGNCRCDRCSDKIEEGFVYHCSICKYDLDISCASMSFEEADMQLVHLHKHPLIPSEHTYEEKQLFCSGCAAPILPGPIFVCSKQKQQCKFVFHKSCAELRKEITHFSHTQHPLTLFEKSPYEGGISYCDRCGDDTKVFVYHCSICKYDLDVMCASLRSNYVVYEEDHEHRFIMVKPAPFTCDICGEESKDKQSYICITCQEHTHPPCSSLPRRVKLFTHRCPLQLTFGHQLEKPIDLIRQYCRTCFQKIDTKYAFYYCVDCEYIADIECTRSETYRDYKFNAEANTAVRFKDEGKIDLQTWHDHGPLILRSDAYEPKTDTRDQVACFGCVSVISSSAPFYECQEKCGYTLHESCANSYENIRHPFHPDHDLVLLDEGNFYCVLCKQPCSGFGYYCKQEGCESPVVFHIKCALRSDVIHIEGAHPHPLRIIMKGEHYEKTCKGCSRGCYSARYSCIEPKCDYNVCYECVGLPTSAKHRWDEHPVELTYESTPRHEKDGGEYYCDECEEPREKDHWFYHCATCERDVHPKCAVLHNLDLTRPYTIGDIHPGHDLIIVANPQVYPTCSNCGLPCKDLYCQCQDCKYCTHYACPNPP